MISFDARDASPLDCGVTQPAPLFSWDGEELRPKMANGGIFFPDFENGSCRSAPPKNFEVREAVALTDARDPDTTDTKNIASKSHLNWARAAAPRSERI